MSIKIFSRAVVLLWASFLYLVLIFTLAGIGMFDLVYGPNWMECTPSTCPRSFLAILIVPSVILLFLAILAKDE